MKLEDIVRTPEGWVEGYKAFDKNWRCEIGMDFKSKQYTCPGEFKEDVVPNICKAGMHFCISLVDCFKYYTIGSHIRLAKVIAKGDIDTDEREDGDTKCCTNYLEIVEEISVYDALFIVNNDRFNVGHHNTGAYNFGDYNVGSHNNGSFNTGDYNLGYVNCGVKNNGVQNIGNYNIGDYNRGKRNIGNYNIGINNIGVFNVGRCNKGAFNIGNNIVGMFNKPVDDFPTFADYAYHIPSTPYYLKGMPAQIISLEQIKNILSNSDLTSLLDEVLIDARKSETYTYHVILQEKGLHILRQIWWEYRISDYYGPQLKKLPNFDAEIFKKITGIDVTKTMYYR